MDKQEVDYPLSDTMSPIEKIRQLGSAVRRTVRSKNSVQFSRLSISRQNESINDDSYLDEDDLLSVDFRNSNVRVHSFLLFDMFVCYKSLVLLHSVIIRSSKIEV